jgi:hypothetical protein
LRRGEGRMFGDLAAGAERSLYRDFDGIAHWAVARPSSWVARWRLSVMAVVDGWPPARNSGCTEPGLQASSPAA